ncbi:MAG TPA: choice-of-anchor D domain-containing protein, partial [Gemmatimonadales bacterium]|nr:choice-of-anchor D domain-containing protein [Gemmatimonadales bacterium]
PISVSNGTYSINCAPPYLTVPGTVTAGTTVCVHHVTPLALGMGTATTLTVGAVSSTFQSYTTYDSPLTPPARIAAGISHNLVVADDVANGYGDALWAWGDNTAGKLGINSTVTTSIPSRAFYGSVMNVAAGMSHSLALDYSGRVFSWGLNRDGQLGVDPALYGTFYCKVPGETGLGPGGTFFCRPEPVQVPGLDNVVAVSAGWGHSLALKSDGTVWAWGSGIYGQNGDAGFLDRKSPVQVPIGGMVTRIAAGYFHSVALRSDGTVVVWGQGSHGELGPASLVPKTATPVVVTGLTGVTDIAAGGAYTLARKSDLSLVAWGSNVYGTLGDSSSYSFRQSPAPVSGMTDVAEFTAGFGFALARKTGGSVWGWGLNNRGQLNGTAQATPKNCGLATGRSCFLTPTQLSGLGGVSRIVAGGAHTVSVRPSQALVIIGDNAAGQHGDQSGNYGVPFASGRPPFVQELYDPDTFTNPAGTFGTPGGVGASGTAGGLNLGSLGDGIAFGPQGVGIPSPALAVTLSNLSATDTITVSGVTAAGDAVAGEFSATGCIGTLSVAPSACTINVVFNPADLGARYGTLTITSNAANSGTMSFALLGTGVDPRPTSTTTLTASANPISAGASVTFTAVVSASPTPAGAVAFRDGGVTIAGCGAVALSGGAAGCTTSALAAGVRSITAAYLDGGSAQPSTSSALTMSVLAPNPLTVSRSGAGSGTVASSPAGIDCGAACSANFASGTPVTLTASPANGSLFTGWGGDCAGTGPCVVTMSAARNVTATFALQSLSLSVASTGSGTVSSSPPGIDCATCSASFPFGTSVTLTAAPGAGFQFAGWGGACSGTGQCTVTLDAAKSVTASFTSLPPANFALTVTLAGGGTGTVSSNPAGINCGVACLQSFASGQAVTLMATPGANSTFGGWSGACSGTGSCVVTMDAAKGVTATFTVTPGLVSPSPASLDFGGQSMNTTAPALAVALTNSGGLPVTVSSVSASTYFAVTHDCATVNAGASCTANVTFTPTAEGSLNGTLTVAT